VVRSTYGGRGSGDSGDRNQRRCGGRSSGDGAAAIGRRWRWCGRDRRGRAERGGGSAAENNGKQGNAAAAGGGTRRRAAANENKIKEKSIKSLNKIRFKNKNYKKCPQIEKNDEKNPVNQRPYDLPNKN
jgi:hypothetical protein